MRKIDVLFEKNLAHKPLTLDEYEFLIPINECCDCDSLLDNIPIKTHDYAKGFNVKGFKEKQMLYKTCPVCGRDNPLWDLGVSR